VRPIANVGSIYVFDSAAQSVYHGMTVSVRRRMKSGLYFRLAFTFAKATDDIQDALLAGASPTVQNTYAPNEWGRSVTDQRHRLSTAWSWQPKPFHQDRPKLKAIFNDWQYSGVLTVGSGRPFDARVLGDANRDENTSNDRLPGYVRNSFTGPDYATVDVRLTRMLYPGDKVKVQLLVEAFNVMNRTNYQVDTTDDGFLNNAAEFIPIDRTISGSHYPAYYTQSPGFMKPTSAYASRQVQVGIRLKF
jgi:acyl dehydratase